MIIKTMKLQEMVSKVILGASNNKLIPMTQLIQIEVKNNTLELTTTDATNYIKIKENNIETDDFYVVVNADTFAKLIGKITKEEVELILTDNSLIVKGNGEYKLEIQLDEDGNLIKFPDVFSNYELSEENKQTIKTETINKILNTNKAALATTMEIPCYTGYYFGKDVISTDTYKICALDTNIFNQPVLISPSVMELLKVFDNEVVDVYILDNYVMFWKTDTIEIYSHQLDGIENYAVDAISSLVNSDMDCACIINKQSFLNMLDRLSLFVSPYDQNVVTFKFTDEGILCESKQSTGSELISYIDKDSEHLSFECNIDIITLSTQIKAIPTETFELWYGANNAIKIISDDITQIISLSE